MNPKLPTFFKDPHALSGSDPHAPILVGLSGGADSSLLLHLLCRLKEERDFPLYAAHVNHGIRTENYENEAQRDEDFCRTICKNAGVRLFVKSIDVPSLAEKSGNSLETEAREARYDFFAEIMKTEGIGILATAHNADDNLETQIFNLCRGCGISGICGIPEVRPLQVGVAVRPILGAKKSDVVAYCQENGIPFVTDSTNFENDCTRNRIRNIIIPELNSIFNSPQSSALRLSRAAREDNLYLESEALRFISCRSSITTSELCALPLPIAKRALITLFDQTAQASLEEVHIDAVLGFANSGKSGSVSLPGKMRARISDGYLYFEKDKQEECRAYDYNVKISEGLTVIDGTDYLIFLGSEDAKDEVTLDENSYKLYSTAYAKNIDPSTLTAGNRREGEVILDGGMHKKLKKLMCDKKIPTNLRDLPILRQGDEAIYAPSCAVSDKVRAKRSDADLIIAVYVKLP